MEKSNIYFIIDYYKHNLYYMFALWILFLGTFTYDIHHKTYKYNYEIFFTDYSHINK